MKFNSKPIPEHKEVPLADDGRWEKIIEQWTTRDVPRETIKKNEGNACYVLSISYETDPVIRNAQLAEILNLVRAQGDHIVGDEIYHLSKTNPRTLLGKGVSRDIAARARASNADLLVLNAELTPSQMRNLEDNTGIAISDREGVILNVFLRHARTRRARIQVEIAQLGYLRPRIRGIGINMDQQAGGISGGKGPGETASELLARKIDGRLAALRKVQRKLERSSETQRQRRVSCKRIVLVGYTNAGKTSLMNALTAEALSARDMLFETLDTTTRYLSRHGGDVLISDTVGFIRRLPKRLLASFESTLEEICEASLLVIVVDVADYEWQEQVKTTLGMLKKLGVINLPRFYVFNKADCLPSIPNPHLLESLSEGHPFMLLSCRDEVAVLGFKKALLQCVHQEQKTVVLFIPYTATRIMSMIYKKCRVMRSYSAPEGLQLNIQVAPKVLGQIKRQLKELSK